MFSNDSSIPPKPSSSSVENKLTNAQSKRFDEEFPPLSRYFKPEDVSVDNWYVSAKRKELKTHIANELQRQRETFEDHPFEQGHAKELCQRCGEFKEDHK